MYCIISDITWKIPLWLREARVQKRLEKLNLNKSPGQDGLHPRVLKELSVSTRIPLGPSTIHLTQPLAGKQHWLARSPLNHLYQHSVSARVRVYLVFDQLISALCISCMTRLVWPCLLASDSVPFGIWSSCVWPSLPRLRISWFYCSTFICSGELQAPVNIYPHL